MLFDTATDQALKAFVTAVAGVSGTTIVGVCAKIWRIGSRIERRLDQHDIMWESFCLEHKIPNIAKLGKSKEE